MWVVAGFAPLVTQKEEVNNDEQMFPWPPLVLLRPNMLSKCYHLPQLMCFWIWRVFGKSRGVLSPNGWGIPCVHLTARPLMQVGLCACVSHSPTADSFLVNHFS